jgi:hypothetical protein
VKFIGSKYKSKVRFGKAGGEDDEENVPGSISEFVQTEKKKCSDF